MARIALTPQPEDRAVIDAVAPLLAEEFSLAALAKAPGEAGADFWPRVAALGWTAAALDEAHGGVGFDLAQEMLMNREYGRYLAPVSLVSTALGLRLFAEAGRAQIQTVVDGRERIGFAAFTGAGAIGETLTGEVQLVDAGAQHFLIATHDGAAVFSKADIGAISPTECLDPTTPLARAVLDGVAATYLPAGRSGLPFRLRLMIAAQLTGIALAASEMAAEYAKIRIQFGKPIGAFQAVAHLCVDAAVQARACDAQIALAAIAARDGRPDAPLQVVSAALIAANASLLAATSNIQVHGGMGYSAESGAHLYLKRAVLLRRLLPSGPEPDAILLSRQRSIEHAT